MEVIEKGTEVEGQLGLYYENNTMNGPVVYKVDTVAEAITLYHMITDRDLRDDSIASNLIKLVVFRDGMWEYWYDEDGDDMEAVINKLRVDQYRVLVLPGLEKARGEKYPVGRHTQGTLRVHEMNDGTHVILSDQGKVLAEMVDDVPPQEKKANAHRFVRAVNFCDGVPDGFLENTTLKDLITTLRFCATVLRAGSRGTAERIALEMIENQIDKYQEAAFPEEF